MCMVVDFNLPIECVCVCVCVQLRGLYVWLSGGVLDHVPKDVCNAFPIFCAIASAVNEHEKVCVVLCCVVLCWCVVVEFRCVVVSPNDSVYKIGVCVCVVVVVCVCYVIDYVVMCELLHEVALCCVVLCCVVLCVLSSTGQVVGSFAQGRQRGVVIGCCGVEPH